MEIQNLNPAIFQKQLKIDWPKKYTLISKLGQGQYGKVYSGQDSQGNKFAIKKLKNLEGNSNGLDSYTLREISALKMLKHQNIIKLEEIIKNSSIYIVMEQAQSNLSEFIDKYGGKSLQIFQIQNIMGQLLSGISYMHSRCICHRDIKPENILISNEGFLKICDFGLSRYINSISSQLYTTNVVAQVYRAPELLLNFANYSTKIDI